MEQAERQEELAVVYIPHCSKSKAISVSDDVSDECFHFNTA